MDVRKRGTLERRDWNKNKEMWIRVLERQTGQSLDSWRPRVRRAPAKTEKEFSVWLAKQGISGYAAQLLTMERFGYPDFLTASGNELIERQYADRAELRPIYDAIVNVVAELGNVAIQARKGFVSFVTPRRTFARVQAATKTRVDLGLRLEGLKPAGRLQPSRIHATMPLQVALRSRSDLDKEVIGWLRRAYAENS